MTFSRPIRPPASRFGRPPVRPAQAPSLAQRMAAKFLSRALPAMNADQRFEFEERVAICMYHGGLCEADAVRVALDDFARRIPPRRPRR